jgi:protein-S-isoprenylcysteine O-methyltransferase Ste14
MTHPPAFNLGILGCFILLGTAMMVLGYRAGRQGTSMLGKPTITPWQFYTGKLCVFLSWALLILSAAAPDLLHPAMRPFQPPLAFGLMAAGTLVMIWAFYSLGSALRVGLPENETKLSTGGIYRITRNPIYLGVLLINASSCVFFPNLFNVCISLIAVVIHHRIILGEERFLQERFGQEWTRYKKRTGRYIIF